MCTVTYFKDKEKVVLTSNRDEHINRPLAKAPQEYIYGMEKFYYPLDPISEGSWFGVKNSGHVFVLLNGADKKHIPHPPYRMSRGVILLDLMKFENFTNGWQGVDLSGIEPFTVIHSGTDVLTQVQWNGLEKSSMQLDIDKAHIWSSATLYEQETIHKRKAWFSEFLSKHQEGIRAEDMIDFHSNTHINDIVNGLIINRNDVILTKNITQCVREIHAFELLHIDLIANEQTSIIQSIG